MNYRKELGTPDDCGFYFAKELLDGDTTAAVNFDRIQQLPNGKYIIFEYLRCKETQPRVTPYTSHPNKYWEKDKRKFLFLWQIAQDLGATLYLVNYAAKGERNDDQVLLIKVKAMDDTGILDESKTKFKRNAFQKWFRIVNQACLS